VREEQDFLSGAALTAFRLNGQFLTLAEDLAKPAGLTAAWWQVLGAVLPGPLSVAGIAREMGMARQSVQRIADLLVERGMAEYADNPAHRRAKLLVVTDAGLAAVRRIDPRHRDAAHALVAILGTDRAAEVLAALTELSRALDDLAAG
jgi:DNA-binding MarR family transcriptional regulator